MPSRDGPLVADADVALRQLVGPFRIRGSVRPFALVGGQCARDSGLAASTSVGEAKALIGGLAGMTFFVDMLRVRQSLMLYWRVRGLAAMPRAAPRMPILRRIAINEANRDAERGTTRDLPPAGSQLDVTPRQSWPSEHRVPATYRRACSVILRNGIFKVDWHCPSHS